MKRSIKTLLALPVIAGIMLSSGCNASRATTRALIVNFSASEKEYMEEIEEQASKLETTTQKPAENSAVNSQDGGNQGNANGNGSDNGNTGNGDNNGNNNNNNNGGEGNKPSADNNSSASGSTTSKNENQTSNSNGGTNTSKPSGGNATTPSSSQGQSTPAPETSASQGGSGGNDTPASSASSSSSAAASTTKPAPSTTPSSFIADWQPSSTWSDGANYCGGYELKVENKTGKDLTSWTATFTVPSGFKFTSSWNGDFSVSGTTATVKNLEYNGNVANGGTIGFGFNYSSPVEFTPGNVSINGVGSSNGSAGGSDTATSTAAAVTTVKPAPADPVGVTPFAAHGKLTVKGTQIVDKNGNAYQLKGMSTHGLAWFPKFINESCFKTLRDDWKINCIRIAMYTAEYAGYCEGGNKAELKKLIDNAVTYADKLGLYVIIDWHILQDKTPQKYKADAKLFFEEMASKYKNHNNVLYEICNEPNSGATWTKDIKPYAEEIIPIIRKYNKDAIVIVGTPTWSQDIDQALSSPLKYSNVMYALHFYAATHTDWLRNRLKDCVNKGLPVFVTEFGCCDASGNGANDFNQTKQWLKLLDSYGISYMNWNLANKNESSSAFKEKAGATGNWSSSDFSESGAWIRKWFRGEIA